MKRPPSNQPDDDEVQGVTQEANFPLAWIKDYNPQIHGIRPQAKIQQLQQPPAHFQQPPAHFQQPVLPANQQPVVPARQTPEPPRQQPPAYPPQPQVLPNQQVGTFGGQPEKKSGFFPWWGWAIIAVLALLLIAETSVIVFR